MAIQVSDISKNYGSQKALDRVSFEIGTGELVGFLGPNGAGKSTMMKIITGFLQADAGEVRINGEAAGPEFLGIRNQIGYLPENNPLYTDLFVREYLEMTAGFYKLRNVRTRVSEVIEMVGLTNERHKKIGALSKGYRQRVGLAQALIHDPSVLILDEPTTGLDPNQLEEIRSLIRNISKNKTVMLSTHIMQEVEAVCSRALIINKGRLVADGTVGSLKSGMLTEGQIVFAEFDRMPNLSGLRRISGIRSIDEVGPRMIVIRAADCNDIRPSVFLFAVEHNLVLLTLREQQQSLENVFQELTRRP